MKRLISALTLCFSLLVFTSLFLMSAAQAEEEDVILTLLNMPAPPPPNPLLPLRGKFTEEFFDKVTPPPDDAPIEELIAYWSRQSSMYQELAHNITPSPRVASRLLAEISNDPSMIGSLINIFRGNADAARSIKDLYERTAQDAELETGVREQMRQWLTYESPYFSTDLEKKALQVTDVGEYVSNHDDLLALGRNDWERAAPIVNQLYADTTKPVSRIAALWTLYRRAMDSGSVGDADRYRDELKAIVEDKNATPAMRDLALDGLVKEKEWGGRDEWYFSLLSDETLADLRVNGQSYTGLTTIIYHAPKNKYKDKMIEFAGSDNKVVRTAAVKNLMIMLSSDVSQKDADIARAMLPWLSDPKWCDAGEGVRSTYIRMFQKVKLPDAVPGLISLLDEKELRPKSEYSYGGAANAANAAAYAANMAANAVNMAAYRSNSYANANAANVPLRRDQMEEYTPYRMSAIPALDNQGDARAIPALRKLLNEMDGYVLEMLVKALVSSGGFTIPEQMKGLETVVNQMTELKGVYETSIKNAIANLGLTGNEDLNDPEIREMMLTQMMNSNAAQYQRREETESIETMIGNALIRDQSPSEELIRALTDRIRYLDKQDPGTANALREIFTLWKGTTINTMLLSDLKEGKAGTEAIVKLLAIRKELREKQINDVYDVRGGKPVAASVAACILEDTTAMNELLSSGNESAAAVLACARLIRAKLSIPTAIGLMDSNDKRLSLAAERYLESEDSPQSRQAILARYPGTALILGATTHFDAGNKFGIFTSPMMIAELFASVGAYEEYGPALHPSQFADQEKKLREEVLADQDLLGVYSYESDQIRIYTDRITYRNVEDTSRFRERPMTAEEFDQLRQYMTQYNVDQLVPFISCGTECEPKQLLMLGRNGGRRVFQRTTRTPEFFAGLEKFFKDLRSGPMQLKYAAGSDIPGLEILFADDENNAVTVWKGGNDLRVLVRNKKIREKVNKELREALDNYDYDAEDDMESEDGAEFVSPYETYRTQTEARAFEGVSWFSVNDGDLGNVSAPPDGINIPPALDALNVRPELFNWHATAGATELRSDESSLYKLTHGKLTKIRSGNFSDMVISSNGRWAIAKTYDEEADLSLVRIDLSGQRNYPIDVTAAETDDPVCFIPAVNRFLLMSSSYYDHYQDHSDNDTEIIRQTDMKNTRFALLDPDTGKVQIVAGEFRPLAQQTFRRLQQAGKPHEHWAAIPDNKKNETLVGIYDSRTFGFRPLMTLPKITFDSMGMWVDEAERKVYFVYKGHLLAAALPRNPS